MRACKEDIRNNHCKRSVSDNRDIRLVQILLCLETAEKNGSKIAPECKVEMYDHRKILMEDYRLSPAIVEDCAKDITQFCNGLEVGGVTIHCLMEHTRTRKKKSRVSPECQRAVIESFEYVKLLWKIGWVNFIIEHIQLFAARGIDKTSGRGRRLEGRSNIEGSVSTGCVTRVQRCEITHCILIDSQHVLHKNRVNIHT